MTYRRRNRSVRVKRGDPFRTSKLVCRIGSAAQHGDDHGKADRHAVRRAAVCFLAAELTSRWKKLARVASRAPGP